MSNDAARGLVKAHSQVSASGMEAGHVKRDSSWADKDGLEIPTSYHITTILLPEIEQGLS